MLANPQLSRTASLYPPAGGIELLIVQPSPFCNINCDYCYLPERDSHARMSIRVFTQVIERLISEGLIGERLSIVWHAGEPLALPITFYEEALAVLSSLSIPRERIAHSIQTNGMLLNDRWCSFITDHDIRLGLSIDGPAFIHDAHRKTRNGNGTHAQIMKNVELLRRHEIDFHVIAVVTEESLDFADEIFQFFLDYSIQRVGFNIEELEGTNLTSSLAEDANPDRVRAFFRRIYELQKSSNGAIQVREFDRAYQAIALAPINDQQDSVVRNDQVEPFAIVSIAHDGSLSTFSPELLGLKSVDYGDFTFGNVLSDQIQEMVARDKFQRVLLDIKAGVDLCARGCEYFSFCGGGAPANKYYENGSFVTTETMFCRYTVKTPVDIVLADLESSLGIDSNIHNFTHLQQLGGK